MTEISTQIPMLHLPTSTLTALHRALHQDRSPADAAALARQIGFDSGEGFHRALSAWLGDQDDQAGLNPDGLSPDEFWHQLSNFFFNLGWGGLHFERPHPGVASLSSSDWAEADPATEADQPTCHFSTGMLADLLGRISGDDLAVLEVECRSRGDENCRFLLGGTDALESVYEGVRHGGFYGSALEQLP